MSQHAQLAGHADADDQPFAGIGQLAEIEGVAGKTVVERPQRLLARGSDKEAVELIEILVADGSLHGPVVGKTFVVAQDFFDHDVQRMPARRTHRVILLAQRSSQAGLDLRPRIGYRLRRDGWGIRLWSCIGDWRLAGIPGPATKLQEPLLLQLPQVAPRIEQAIGVVDPQAVHQAAVEQVEHQGVGAFENLRMLDADGRQLVDVEEAAIVDFVGRHAPIGQAIRLLAQQLIQAVEAVGIALPAVELMQRLGQDAGNRRRAFGQLVQAAFDDLFFSLPLDDALAVGFVARRQVLNRRQNAQILQQVGMLAAELLLEGLDPRRQNQRVRPGSDRQPRGEVIQPECALFQPHHQLPLFQHFAELIAQHGQQHLVGQVGLEGHPVDIEVGGEGRAGAVFEHVEPPAVAAGGGAHVIGNHIEDQPHLPVAERLHQRLELGRRADLLVDRRAIDDVVAAFAPFAGLQQGRGINVADAEGRQVRHQLVGIAEFEFAVELEAVSCHRQPLLDHLIGNQGQEALGLGRSDRRAPAAAGRLRRPRGARSAGNCLPRSSGGS